MLGHCSLACWEQIRVTEMTSWWWLIVRGRKRLEAEGKLI